MEFPTSEKVMKKFDSVLQSVQENLWNRFIGEDSVLLDYVGLNGEVSLPTPGECRLNQPNALGWWSPIENGGFFNGDYLIGLCAGYRANPEPELRDKIRRLVLGLYQLQNVCSVEGCIARGLGSDGQCHYPASSNDQVVPWMLGLRAYLASGIPDEVEALECRDRLRWLLDGLRANDWKVPGDLPGFDRGSLLNDHNELECRLSAVHIAIATRILGELDGDFSLHTQYLDLPFKCGKTRREFLGEGFPALKPWQCWFTSHSVYALRELLRGEENESYRRALAATGEAASRHIPLWKDYRPGLVFTPEWRVMLAPWREQTNCEEAQACAYEEIALWEEASPAIRMEKATLMPALSAAWIVLLSEDAALIERNLPAIEELLLSLDCSRLHYAAFFYAENVIHELALLS